MFTKCDENIKLLMELKCLEEALINVHIQREKLELDEEDNIKFQSSKKLHNEINEVWIPMKKVLKKSHIKVKTVVDSNIQLMA